MLVMTCRFVVMTTMPQSRFPQTARLFLKVSFRGGIILANANSIYLKFADTSLFSCCSMVKLLNVDVHQIDSLQADQEKFLRGCLFQINLPSTPTFRRRQVTDI